jgi:salicylate hydroxylase
VLAQALARAGDDVSVHDRDAAAAATGGYRLHLDARACAALRRHLAPELFAAIRSSAADPRTFRQFAFTDHRMAAERDWRSRRPGGRRSSGPGPPRTR